MKRDRPGTGKGKVAAYKGVIWEQLGLFDLDEVEP
jgi:hypothetical protein